MATTTIGKAAEKAVAEKLKSQGYEVLALNWKTSVCEIDIIAKKAKIIYFSEVKYRVRASQGGGFEHITPSKQKQMNFAARVWLSQNSWEGDYRMLAAEVSGDNFENIELVEI